MTQLDAPTTDRPDPAAEIRAAAEILRLAIEEDPDDEFATTIATSLVELLRHHADAFERLAAWHAEHAERPADWRTMPLPSPAEEAALKLARAITAAADDDDTEETSR